MLDLLRDRAWHLNTELSLPEYGGHSFNAHVKTLRDEGWVIQHDHVEGPLHRYRLVRKGEPIDYEKTMNVRQEAVAKAYQEALKSVLDSGVALQVMAAVPERYRVRDLINGGLGR